MDNSHPIIPGRLVWYWTMRGLRVIGYDLDGQLIDDLKTIAQLRQRLSHGDPGSLAIGQWQKQVASYLRVGAETHVLTAGVHVAHMWNLTERPLSPRKTLPDLDSVVLPD